MRSTAPMCTPLVSTTTLMVPAQPSSGINCRTPYSICSKPQTNHRQNTTSRNRRTHTYKGNQLHDLDRLSGMPSKRLSGRLTKLPDTQPLHPFWTGNDLSLTLDTSTRATISGPCVLLALTAALKSIISQRWPSSSGPSHQEMRCQAVRSAAI